MSVPTLCTHVQLSYWTSSEICSVSDAKVRGVLIEKFIEVAKVSYGYLLFHCLK